MEDRNRLLIVDDSRENIRVLIEILKRDYQLNATTDGLKAVEISKKWNPDVILLDVVMPNISGYDVCMQLKACEETKGIPIVFATAVSDPEEEIACIKVGALDYVKKPIEPKLLVAKIKNFVQIKNERTIMLKLLKSKKAEVDAYVDSLLNGSANLAEYGEKLMAHPHVRRRLELTRVFVKALLSNVRFSELLEDDAAIAVCGAVPYISIGNFALPADIIQKPDEMLTPEEFDIMKTHVNISSDMEAAVISETGGGIRADTALSVIRRHHERWDGTGYPDGLKAAEIPLCAQITALVNQYDELTDKSVSSETAYHFEAVRIISAESGKGYNPELINEFLEVQDDFLVATQEFPVCSE